MQGYYTADGTNKYLEIPIDINWVKITNYTQWDAGAGADDQMLEAEWRTGMPYGIGKRKNTANDDLESVLLTEANAIVPFNSGDNPLGTTEVHTGITNTAPPVMTVADSSLYPTGSIVKLGLSTVCSQIQGLDFTVAYNDGTHIDLAYMVAPGAACTDGNVTPLKWDTPWYPRKRSIASFTQAAQAVIQMTVTHGFAVGDVVRLMVPSEFGMVEANLKEVKVTAVNTDITTNTNTITVDLDTRAYTAFTWPNNGDFISKFAEVIPISGPVNNATVRGVKVVAGKENPGGVANDVIYWIAGDSFGI